MITIILFYLLSVYFNQPIPEAPKQEPVVLAISTDRHVEMVNELRTAAGLKPLKYNQKLSVSATIKACDMQDNNYFAHKNLKGEMSWGLIKAQVGQYINAGENLAKGYGREDAAVIQGFMNSATHKANVLSPFYDSLGVGRCGDYTVEHFADL